MNPLRQLQQLRLSDEEYDDLIELIKIKKIPKHLQNPFQHFIVRDNKLIYEPLNLEYIPPKKQMKTMEVLYDQIESAGKGQNNFYRWITTKYLGINKRQSQAFLKSREDYQLTRDPHKTMKKPLLANRPFQFFAMYLVDMNQYLSVRQNKQKRYILSIMDLFSGFTWFEAIKTKEPKEILKAFQVILSNRYM